MAEYLLIILVTFVIIYALVKGCHVNINITVKQEFSHEDRQLLEDLFNDKGDVNERELDIKNTLDDVVKNINAIMLDEEETDG